jgi:GNAT superfamily N-acetyltransferase
MRRRPPLPLPPLPPLRFRRARPADIPAMTAIRLNVTENVLSDPRKVTRRMYEDYLHAQGRGWVCCSGRKIVGFAYASKVDASIWALFIQPGHEGRGIGRKLLAFAVNWLFALGHPAVTLSTRRGTRAARFYAASGWRPEGDDFSDDVTFRKLALTSPAQG